MDKRSYSDIYADVTGTVLVTGERHADGLQAVADEAVRRHDGKLLKLLNFLKGMILDAEEAINPALRRRSDAFETAVKLIAKHERKTNGQ